MGKVYNASSGMLKLDHGLVGESGLTLSNSNARQERMKTTRELTAIIEREGDGYVSLCPELDVAGQGDTIEEARANLIEALELFFETASEAEVHRRLRDEVLITRVKVAV